MRISYPSSSGDDQRIAAFECTVGTDWTVAGDVGSGPFGLVISRLEVRRPGDSTGVTSSMLRKIPVGEILATIKDEVGGELIRHGGDQLLAGVVDVKPPRLSGRVPLPSTLLRDVAMAYIEENAPGKGAGAMVRIAERFGKPEETVRRWVARARKEGWLGPGAKGRAGAEPGQRLAAELRDKGLIEIEPPDGALTASDLISVKRGAEAQVVEYNRLIAEWQGLPADDPRKAGLERQIKSEWSRKSGQ